MAQIKTLQWVDVDESPLDAYATDADPDGKVHLADEYDDLAEPWREALHTLVTEHFDSATCQSASCPGRSGPVGYALAGDADEYTRWHWVTLVMLADDPTGAVYALCEECSPSMTVDLLPAAEPYAKRP